MKIEFDYADHHEVFESPVQVHLIGVTIINNGRHLSAWDFELEDESHQKDEVINLDENLKLIFHYYTGEKIGEMRKEFHGYEGMKFIEIKNNEFNLIVFV